MTQIPISNLQPPSVAATITDVPEATIRALLEQGTLVDHGDVSGRTLVSVGDVRRLTTELGV
ncbi:hypothetical protein D6T63_04210 [Arthrobacter cheniae]|uniref:Uncharacterized protein n=1 Tax=Arthrobacter cheniae TaxID=1258888 RepID=A0A3A5MG86_9MICC|nr:hypothetical protein [Arthrobacter cheniae]RJT81958.1 hypothetical protein D6T63_04210 [Arthrobacter cheniae]